MVAGAALLLACSCAKTVVTNAGEEAKRLFDAWMYVHYPNLEPTELGAYVLEETEGSGELVGSTENAPYLRVNYTVTDLDGEVSMTSYESMSKQLGEYNSTYYYGPRFWYRSDDALYAGLDEAVSTMRVGGKKTTIVPGWLITSSRYDTAEEYVTNASGSSSSGIYSVEIVEIVEDVVKWEIDSLTRYLSLSRPDISPGDSLKYGFYYKQITAPTDTTSFTTDSTLYINYIGRLLNGKVFDTNIADTAKRYDLYSTSGSYSPVQINWDADDYTAITMTSDETSLIDGFAYALSRMRSYEKGVAIFYSGLGYGSSGSGNTIPEYSPLIFEIEFVDEE